MIIIINIYYIKLSDGLIRWDPLISRSNADILIRGSNEA